VARYRWIIVLDAMLHDALYATDIDHRHPTIFMSVNLPALSH
jgi:hypothetical protein